MVSPGFKLLFVGVNRFAISPFFETRPGSLHELCLVLAYEVNVFARLKNTPLRMGPEGGGVKKYNS